MLRAISRRVIIFICIVATASGLCSEEYDWASEKLLFLVLMTVVLDNKYEALSPSDEYVILPKKVLNVLEGFSACQPVHHKLPGDVIGVLPTLASKFVCDQRTFGESTTLLFMVNSDTDESLSPSSVASLKFYPPGSACSGDPDWEPEDPHSDSTGLTEEYDDNIDGLKKRFRQQNKLKKNPIAFVRSQLSLFKTLTQFASKYPAHGRDVYQMISNLHVIKTPKLVSNWVMYFFVSLDVGEADFNNKGVAFARALIIPTRNSLNTFLPMLIGDGWPMFAPSMLWLSIAITAGLDNVWAHATNSSYALPWGSEDSINFAARTAAATWFNFIILKNLYASSIIKPMSQPLAKINGGLASLTVSDFFASLFLSYMLSAARFSGYPGFSATAGANPYGPAGDFPWPYCSPDIKWIPWHSSCSGGQSQNSTDELPPGVTP